MYNIQQKEKKKKKPQITAPQDLTACKIGSILVGPSGGFAYFYRSAIAGWKVSGSQKTKAERLYMRLKSDHLQAILVGSK